MKKLVLVAGHFPPSNLTAGHRSRLWSMYLQEFGWEPIVVTTHWKYYEEPLDWELEELLPADLRVIRTRAIPVRPFRIVGDIGIRAFWWHYQAIKKLSQDKDIDFLHITIPSHFSAPLGRLVYKKLGIPYGIDYIDPWVHRWPGVDRALSRAWWSYRVSLKLEPWSVRNASLITGVAKGYYSDMLSRNPEVAQNAVCAAMPYGIAPQDYQKAKDNNSESKLFDKTDGLFHLVYAGAMLLDGYVILDNFLDGLRLFLDKKPDVAGKLRVHFIGTGSSHADPEGYNILPRAREKGLQELVTEHPLRIPYCDVLRHLMDSSGVLVLGSTKAHYTPSKVFQAILSRRPVLAILHKDSTALNLVQDSRAGKVVQYPADREQVAIQVSRSLESMLTDADYSENKVDWALMDSYSARTSARLLSDALDKAYERHKNGR